MVIDVSINAVLFHYTIVCRHSTERRADFYIFLFSALLKPVLAVLMISRSPQTEEPKCDLMLHRTSSSCGAWNLCGCRFNEALTVKVVHPSTHNGGYCHANDKMTEIAEKKQLYVLPVLHILTTVDFPASLIDFTYTYNWFLIYRFCFFLVLLFFTFAVLFRCGVSFPVSFKPLHYIIC